MKRRNTIAIVLCILLAVSAFVFRLVSGPVPDTSSAEDIGNTLGILSLMPTILAVSLAFLLGDVIVALLIGLVFGQYIYLLMMNDNILSSAGKLVPRTIEECLTVASNVDNVKVLMLCVLIGGLIGVLVKTDGFVCAASLITKKVKSPRGANIICQLFCTLFFFDDYANALISGPVLSPVADKAGLSRERLAYIVDSTAAPVAGISVVSSWVAVEMSVIGTGLEAAGLEVSAFDVFIRSIPYCFYCIFALIFILITSLSEREFGPMLRVESNARVKMKSRETIVLDDKGVSQNEKRRIAVAFGSIVLLVAYLIIGLVITEQDTITLLLQAAFVSTIAAVVLCSVFRISSVTACVKAWLEGVSNMTSTVIVLVLAWSLASTVEKMGTVYYVVQTISAGVVWQLVPAIIFICCCFVSFAAGSYGCMFMIMPMAIPIACAVIEKNPSVGDNFIPLCVSAVLSGGIFGDHCSPMTDCTILAALGSGCEVVSHAYTQMPYAITVAVISVICILSATIGIPVFAAIAIGIVLMIASVLILGKHPGKEFLL